MASSRLQFVVAMCKFLFIVPMQLLRSKRNLRSISYSSNQQGFPVDQEIEQKTRNERSEIEQNLEVYGIYENSWVKYLDFNQNSINPYSICNLKIWVFSCSLMGSNSHIIIASARATLLLVFYMHGSWKYVSLNSQFGFQVWMILRSLAYPYCTRLIWMFLKFLNLN